MQCLLRLVTDDWELEIHSRDIRPVRQRLARVLGRRQPPLPLPVTSLRFSPAVIVQAIEVEGEALAAPAQPCDSLQLPAPLFFENNVYDIEIAFSAALLAAAGREPAMAHHLARINDTFHFSRRGQVLRGNIRTGNDVGGLTLPVQLGAQRYRFTLDVLPLKMDLAGDLAAMYRTLDAEFPYLRFSLETPTEQSAAQGARQRGDFPLLWLAHFKALNELLVRALRQIVNAPHSRLLPEQRHDRADRLKGRVPERLAAAVLTDRENGRHDRRYRQTYRRLGVDTPENRFIRMVVEQVRHQLGRFQALAKTADDQEAGNRLSAAFFQQLHSWVNPFEQLYRHPFFAEIGDYRAMQRESLVLQQKSGYATVYRIWQQLKLYLDFLGQHTSVGMKTVAGLYEIWCVLEVRRILHGLGFEEDSQAPLPLDRRGLELVASLGDTTSRRSAAGKDALAISYRMTRADGLVIRLAHQPSFGEKTVPVRSWLNLHKPDIALEVTFPQQEKILWLFDAKYRIDAPANLESTADDRVPEDAINQMHRYRDALIYRDPGTLYAPHSRPTFGAFALYPGYFDQQAQTNPYDEAIRTIGVGAFALLPSADPDQGSYWLQRFLAGRLGQPAARDQIPSPERFFIEEPSRIPLTGMRTLHYPDLTLVIPVADPASPRTTGYFAAFEQGEARYYHTPVETIAGRYDNTLMTSIRFLALAIPAGGDRIVQHVWPVLACEQYPRQALTPAQTGTPPPSGNPQPYWLLTLGPSLKLDQPLAGVPGSGFRAAMRLTRLDILVSLTRAGRADFADLADCYAELLQPAP